MIADGRRALTRQVRDKLDITQAHLAQLLGVHELTISKWERGLLSPSDYQKALLEEFRFAADHDLSVGARAIGLLFARGPVAALLELLSVRAAAAERQEVSTCSVCPFASDGTTIGDAQWRCHGQYTPEGWPSKLPPAPERPPIWCPLRRAPRLLVLAR